LAQFLKGTSKAEIVSGAAQEAFDAGQQFFVFEAGSSFRSAVEGVAEALEAIEGIGWHLEHVSHVWSTSMGNHAVGYYVFRRA
jgi:hypothetical protein